MKLHTYFYFCLFLLFSTCTSPQNKNVLFELVDAGQSGISFVNKITESDSMNVLEFMNIYTGGGLAVGDVNNDSLPDLYFSGNMVSSRLYINKSTKDKIRFEDVTAEAGVATDQWISGVTMADVNQDGLLDIYACATGSDDPRKRQNRLFINQGAENNIPHFKESAAEYGLNDTTYTTQASFFDYDRDGDLDVFLIVNYAENFYGNTVSLPLRRSRHYDPNRTSKLYKNTLIESKNGLLPASKKFVDVSLEAGITSTGYNLGVAVSDVNNDGWPDIYVTNDFVSNDLLYINNRNGTFSNKTTDYLKHTSYAGMGVDIADFNNDGRTDIAVVDMIPEDNLRLKAMMNKTNYNRFMLELSNGYSPQFSRNTLQLNNGLNTSGKLSFSEIAPLSGIHHTDWSWSVLFADYDNDGLKDVFITNGFLRDMQDLDFIRYVEKPADQNTPRNNKGFLKLVHQLPSVKVPNYLYKNQGDLTFRNVTETWGTAQPSCSNGAVYADLDNDGDLDLVVSNVNEAPSVYNNLLASGKHAANYLKIHFAGPPGNKQGIGAKVEIKTGTKSQLYENYLSRGFQSSINAQIHAGLGAYPKADEITITWPDGKKQTLPNVKANTQFTADYTEATHPAAVDLQATENLLREANKTHNFFYKHQEDDYVDFFHHRLIPFKMSQNGPSLAVADIDNNGTDDFYIGGSVNYPGNIVVQEGNETFKSKSIEQTSKYEDMGSLFFDADSDSDVDLYIVSGGVEMGTESEYYQDRLYVNDGRGNFTRHTQALPQFYISGSCVNAADYDKDGDLDLFVGGRSVPGQYPLPASSKILRNDSPGKDKPRFSDVTMQVLPSLQGIGMVTASLWTDYNNDGWVDLMLAGEGMPVMFYENKQGKFNTKPILINHSRGYWNSIVTDDFDMDGDMDYVLGNMGLNSILKASEQEPARVYAKDFDINGSLDPILCYYVKGKNVPFHPRDEFVEQMNIMRALFTSYAKYASAGIHDIFSEQELKEAYTLTYENFTSSYLENKGKAEFALRPLPTEAQTAPIYGMMSGDFDGDGFSDLLAAGNSYAPHLAIGWYNASIGTMLKGNGDGNFSVLPTQESGFYIDKDAKAMAEIISSTGQPMVLVSSNADSTLLMEFTRPQVSVVALQPLDAWAEIIYTNGKKSRKEFQYGTGYLSQSTRHFNASGPIKSVTIYDYKGNFRIVPAGIVSAK